ncbi:MAG: DMT family transporter [Cytophagales bacterium]|nr:DMT family transporter [Cytophagales bacterium]
MTTDQQNLKDYLKLHLVVVLLGLTAILGKLITLPALELVIFRTFIASAVFGLIFFFRGERLPLSVFWKMLLIGAVLGVHWLCFFGSAKLANVSVSLVTFSTTAFFTSILEPITSSKRISVFELVLGGLVVLGTSIIFNSAPHHTEGIILGLIAGFLSSVYSVGNRHLAARWSSLSINTVELLGAFVVSLALLPVFSEGSLLKTLPSVSDRAYIFILALICTVLPYLVVVNLLKRFTAFTVNLAVNMEPIYGMIMAWLVFGESEKMDWRFYVGAIIILSTLILHANKKAFSRLRGL